MEKINTKKELIEMLKNLLAIEKDAKNSYEKDIAIFSNKKIIADIESVRKDEEKHIRIIENLLKNL